ncbi:reverse transcriptase domain-containing protein [Tanacetum coccineum]
MVKVLLFNKEKLLELANTPLKENCSVVLQKKLPEKLRDTRRFLIPCDFYGVESCIALADLCVSINLMPLSVWKTLSLPELTPTRMTLELATQTVAYPTGIAEDVLIQVGKFTFLADFVVVDYDVDPRVPLILGRPFLRTAHALVDVQGEELTLRVGDESIHKIDVLDITCEDHFPEVLNVQKSINPMSGSPIPSSNPVFESLSPSLTPFGDSDFLLEETNTFLFLDDSIPSGIDNSIYDSEGDILFLEELLNDDPTPNLPPPLYVMPFGLCNAPGTFQRFMVAIFHDVIEKTMEVFMDEFSVFGDSFSSCLSHLDMMLKRCKDTNLVLNWEKFHFMVKEGIVLGHKISKSGIEVDRAKVDVITKLPPPTTVKGIRSFLDHTGFYRRFIKDFSKISQPMTHILEKYTPFFFSNECLASFKTLKKKLTEAPIRVSSD